MKRPVLFGGTDVPATSSFSGWLLVTWLPVTIMLIAIAIESTHAFSAGHTSGWLRMAFQSIAGPVTDSRWESVHHILRKTGHFTGYGLLGLAWMRAWLIFWREPLLRRSYVTWRAFSLAMALSCTVLVASLDELHQSFMVDRTGSIWDVALDTTGATVMLMFCLAVASARRKA